MTRPAKPFRDRHPLAWTYHRNTSRWAHNTLEPDDAHFQSAAKEFPGARVVRLPEPALLDASLQTALDQRCSCRRYREEPISLASLSTILFTGYGVTGRSVFGSLEFLERPVPSGGGLYPLELYVLARAVAGIEPGVYHYSALDHALEEIRDVLIPRPVNDYLFMGQRYLTDAAAIVVMTAEVERSLVKYADRGYRYILFEAGHCAQNLNLAAAALGLGSCNIGGFFDQELAELLTADTEFEVPLYAVAVGVPVGLSKSEMRAVPTGAEPSSSD